MNEEVREARRAQAHWWRTRELEAHRDKMIKAIKACPKYTQPGRGDLPKFYAAEAAIDAYIDACVEAETRGGA